MSALFAFTAEAGSLVHVCSFLFPCFVKTRRTEPHLIWIWSQMAEALINLPAGLLVPSQYQTCLFLSRPQMEFI